MASNALNDTPIRSTQPVLARNDESHLDVTASELTENDIQTLPTAPTADTTASPFALTQTYENLKAEERKAATKPKQPCHFMELPPELRFQIYQLVFRDALEKTPCKGRLNEETGEEEFREAVLSRHIRTTLALLHTSHTLRAEGLAVCRELACTFQQSVKSSLDRLKPGWMGRSDWLSVAMNRIMDGRPDRKEYHRNCEELQQCFEDVTEIRWALRLVQSNVSKRCVKKKDEGLMGAVAIETSMAGSEGW
jgi:hypothetical protein